MPRPIALPITLDISYHTGATLREQIIVVAPKRVSRRRSKTTRVRTIICRHAQPAQSAHRPRVPSTHVTKGAHTLQKGRDNKPISKFWALLPVILHFATKLLTAVPNFWRHWMRVPAAYKQTKNQINATTRAATCSDFSEIACPTNRPILFPNRDNRLFYFERFLVQLAINS